MSKNTIIHLNSIMSFFGIFFIFYFILFFILFWNCNNRTDGRTGLLFQVEWENLLDFGMQSASFVEPLMETCVVCLECTMNQTTGGHVWWVSVLCCAVCAVMWFRWRRSQRLLEIWGSIDGVHSCLYLFVEMKEAIGNQYVWSCRLHAERKYKSVDLEADLCSGLITVFIFSDYGRSLNKDSLEWPKQWDRVMVFVVQLQRVVTVQ